MRKLHINNEEGRDTIVRYASLKPPAKPRMGKDNALVGFRRYLATTDAGLHRSMAAAHGDDYAQALLDGDPEIDLEQVGRTLGESQRVYLEFDWEDKETTKRDGTVVTVRAKVGAGEVRHVPPEVLEVVYGADGAERERRPPKDVEANVNEDLPVFWTGKKMPRAKAVSRFVFKNTLQIVHSDGLTFDYLYDMAKDLDDSDALMLIGGGAKGKSPLVFQTNGTPYRGFLEGRIDGKRYQLLLHLSNMELKLPEEGK